MPGLVSVPWPSDRHNGETLHIVNIEAGCLRWYLVPTVITLMSTLMCIIEDPRVRLDAFSFIIMLSLT